MWLTIALIVIGLAVTVAINAYKIKKEQHYIDVTRTRMETINKALSNYVYKNGHLPCVARYDLQRTDPQYAQSVTCSGGAPTGTSRTTNPARGNRAVWIGTVPVRTLNLSDTYVADINGNLFTYAVTEDVTTGFMDDTLGAIDIVDEAGATTLTTAGSALYALVSHGPDGKGAYSHATGDLKDACASFPGMDQENCDHDDPTFRDAPYSIGSNAQYFDDFILSSTSFVPNCGLQGKIYDGTECVTPKDSFGGTYTMWSGSVPLEQSEHGVQTSITPYPEPPSCRTVNSATSACSCPTDYAPTSIWEWWVPSCHMGFFSNPGGRTHNCTVFMYICLKQI